MLLCCCSPRRPKSPHRSSNRTASVRIRQERECTNQDNIVISRSKPTKFPKAEIGSNEWKIYGKEYVKSQMSTSGLEEKDRRKIVGNSRKIKSKSTSVDNCTNKFQTKQSVEPKSEIVASNKESRFILFPLQRSPGDKDEQRRDSTDGIKSKQTNDEFSNNKKVSTSVEKKLSPAKRITKRLQPETENLIFEEPENNENVLQEDVPIVKQTTKEWSPFDRKKRSNKEAERKIKVLDTGFVNVTSGSRVKLRKTAQGNRYSLNESDKNKDEESTNENLSQNTSLTIGNAAIVVMSALPQESVALQRNKPPQLLPKHANAKVDMSMTTSDEAGDKKRKDPTSVTSSHALPKQLEDVSQSHLTVTKLLQSETSLQSSLCVIERGSTIGQGHTSANSETKDAHNQTNTGLVLESVVSEPYFKKFELSTSSSSCKQSLFVTKNAHSRDNIDQDLASSEESIPSKTCTAATSTASQEAPAHIIEDEEDFSGVVEGPTLKVREIRDKYRGRDYDNYAKPKSSNNNASRKGSDDMSWQSLDIDQTCDDTKEPNNEMKVAQQVMNLFKGALDVEKELTVFEEKTLQSQKEQSNQLSPANRNGHVTTVTEINLKEEPARETRTYVKQTPGKLDSSAWPPVQPEQSEEAEEIETKPTTESAKTETKEVESFDDSLDQFYDVLSDLTS